MASIMFIVAFNFLSLVFLPYAWLEMRKSFRADRGFDMYKGANDEFRKFFLPVGCTSNGEKMGCFLPESCPPFPTKPVQGLRTMLWPCTQPRKISQTWIHTGGVSSNLPPKMLFLAQTSCQAVMVSRSILCSIFHPGLQTIRPCHPEHLLIYLKILEIPLTLIFFPFFPILFSWALLQQFPNGIFFPLSRHE